MRMQEHSQSTCKDRNCLLWPLVKCAAGDCNQAVTMTPASQPAGQTRLCSAGPSEQSLTGSKQFRHERCPSASRACEDLSVPLRVRSLNPAIATGRHICARVRISIHTWRLAAGCVTCACCSVALGSHRSCDRTAGALRPGP